MPLYEYDCMDCGLRSETLRSMSKRDDPFTCPACGSKDTTKAVSTPNVIMPADGTFRGSGKAEMDKRIGASAEQKREHYRQEQQKRNAVRQQSGQAAIGRKSDGTYAPVSQERLQSRENAFKKFDYAKRTGTKVVHES